MSGISVGNGLSKGVGLSVGSGFSRGGGLYFSGFSVAPTLNLDFTTMTALPSTITFSRPSNATYYDSTGKLTYAPNNLLTYSNTFTNGIWGKTNSPTLLAGVLDPTGGMNATRITTTANNTYLFEAVNIQPGVNTVTSIWVRRVSGTGAVNMWTAIGGTGPAITPTSTWTQFSTSGPVSIGTAVYCGLIISTAADVLEVYAATSSIVTYETTPRTQDQVITTSAAYYGARLDYNPATLAARGLLIEEARTNLLPQTNNFSGASWDLARLTRTTDTTLASDGATAAAKYTATAGAATTGAKWFTATSYTIVAGSTYATSMEVDGSSGGYPYISLTTNPSNWATAIFDTTTSGDGVATQTSTTGGTIVSTSQTYLGNGRYRLTLVASVAAGTTAFGQAGIAKLSTGNTFAIYGGVVGTFLGTEYVYASFIQLELGSFATSYIPSATPPTARAADTASMTGTNFSSWYNQSEGTFVANSECGGNSTTGAAFTGHATSAAFSTYIDVSRYQSGTVNTIIVDGSVQSNLIISASIVFGQIYKTAHAYKLNDVAGVANGGTVQTDTAAIIPTTLDRLFIGNAVNSLFLNGHLAYLVYYPQRLPNATLQSLTAPDTAPTGNGLVWGDVNYLIWDTGNFLTWG